jgi:signal transduction histidine kinase
VSLRTRLVLAAAYMLLLAVIALEVPLALEVQRRATKEFERVRLTDAVLIAARINDDLPTGIDPAVPPTPPDAIVDIVDGVARGEGIRIVVTDDLGRVVVDSRREEPVGSVFATPDTRPEYGVVFSAPGGRIDTRQRFSTELGEDLLIVTVPVIHERQAIGAVRITEPTREVAARVRRSWIGLALIGLVVILVGLGAAWFLATSLARRVGRLEAAAGRLEKGDLQSRASVEGPKEVASLANSFNRMAGALGANITAQREFMANASHQLRTPLTGLQLRLEAIEQEGGAAAAQARKALVEVGRLNELVEDLLVLARASSVETTGGTVDLAECARAAVDRWQGPAQQGGKQIIERVDGPCPVWADVDDLGHVLDNLIENSIRYSSEGAEITVQTRTDSGRHALVVSDTGPGIPTEDQARVFERFYRGSAGRRAGPGSGLGLAVVAELVRRWDGDVRLVNGAGTSIEASFPRAPTLS